MPSLIRIYDYLLGDPKIAKQLNPLRSITWKRQSISQTFLADLILNVFRLITNEIFSPQLVAISKFVSTIMSNKLIQFTTRY